MDNVKYELMLAKKEYAKDWDAQPENKCIFRICEVAENMLDCVDDSTAPANPVHVLHRIMNGGTMAPITDEDFFTKMEEDGTRTPVDPVNPFDPYHTASYRPLDINSRIQCPRCPSLVRFEYVDKHVIYRDYSLVKIVNVEDHKPMHNDVIIDAVDDLLHVRMPYFHSIEEPEYTCYARFVNTATNSRYNFVALLYISPGDGTRIDINRYWEYTDDGVVEIDEKAFSEALEKRIDKISGRVASALMERFCANDAAEKTRWLSDIIGPTQEAKMIKTLTEMCEFFEERSHLFTDTVINALCGRSEMTVMLCKAYPDLHEIFVEMCLLENQYNEWKESEEKKKETENQK